jgi:O-antigen/teichoic acid export membrane protein
MCVWLWNSPTFTTWGNYGVQSLRLLLVTPLILTRFDETEIAAWYLFASLNFFGTTITQRLGLTFSRMFAFAMGGASNLAPIKGKREQENGGQPNWASFERAYGTISTLNLGIGWLNVLMALGMGWFGLNNLLQGYEAKGAIWLAFALMQASSLLSFTFQRYSVALQGMNYVALSNRWGIIFSLLSIAAGSLTLWLGGGMIALVLVMQIFSVAGVFRNRHLLRAVEEGRVLNFRQYGFDREVFGWAWAPTWKGFVGQFGLNGSMQLTAIIYTAYGSKSEVASLLFSLRILQTLTQFAQAPFSSVQPLMARLMAAGDLEKLNQIIRERMAYTFLLTAAGVLSGALILPLLLQQMGAKIEFIPISAWLLLGGLTLILRFDVLCCAVSAIGNQMIYYWRMAIATGLTAFAVFLLKNEWGIYGPILASILPVVLLLNIGPLKKSAAILEQTRFPKYLAYFLLILLCYLICSIGLVFFS